VSCSTNIPSGSCQGGDAQLPALSGGVQGLSFFTSGGFPQTFFVSSGSGQSVQMQLADFGPLTGTISSGTLIPVDWVFSMAGFSGATIQSWTLGFELGSSAGLADYGFASGSGAGGGSVSGSSVLNVTKTIPGGPNLFETVLLTMTVNSTGFGSVQVTVPAGATWDFQSVASSSVPEPASLGMIGAGLAFLGALVRRRRKQ
jgi:PEP-CTERM motif